MSKSAMMSRSRRFGYYLVWLLGAATCYVLFVSLLQHQQEESVQVQVGLQVKEYPVADNTVPENPTNSPNSPRTHRLNALNDDYQKLIDLPDFSFIMNTECPEDPGPLVVIVHTAPTHFEYREAIRSTWGSSTKAKLVFMLGAVSNETLQWQLENESLQYDDLVQGSFEDTYRNLTYKHVMAFKWVKYHCKGYQHVLKTDDDIYVNLQRLINNVQKGVFTGKRQIFCDYIKSAAVKRSWRSKWHVSFSEYKHKFYPTYCPGWLVLYNQDLIERLYSLAQNQRFFWIDDVQVTGILGKKAGITHKPIQQWMMSLETYKDKLIVALPPEEQCKYFKNVLFGPNELTPKLIRLLWEALKDCPS
ncbi:Hypothetical predicted protein [Cloeon dipterum]|uniref:Hexosyltransferase n=2 Tax=Cloeon dipterum TaxID=197152 RepID=A0A8S1CAA9_9INSE|nr:Hypothetical predicted protein [Cloeon dipterum]